MLVPMNTGHVVRMKKVLIPLVFMSVLSTGHEQTKAALLDGFLGPVERSLAARVEKKGERLTLGNFYTPERPDSHAPIGVMQDHTRNEGEFMMSFRYMHMDMDENRTGTSTLSDAQVLSQFPIAPTDMATNMYMFSAMYGFNQTVTLMAMLPYVEKSMNHVTRPGGNFKPSLEGSGTSSWPRSGACGRSKRPASGPIGFT